MLNWLAGRLRISRVSRGEWAGLAYSAVPSFSRKVSSPHTVLSNGLMTVWGSSSSTVAWSPSSIP